MNKIVQLLAFFFILSISIISSINIVSAQTYSGENATGWSQLYDDGNLAAAAFAMYDKAFVGWVVAILFFIYQVMLWLKTRNVILGWITGAIFVSLYLTSEFVKTASAQIIFVILVMELAGILYYLFWK